VAEILAISPEKPEPQLIERAVELLRRGEVVGVPTDTLYGLAADPFNLAAVARLYQIKGRPERRALPILIASIDQAEELVGDLPDIFFHLSGRFWPGPLTLVVDASRRVPLKVTGNTGRVALRIPRAKIPCALINALGTPVTGTSANLSGFSACLDAGQVVEQLGERLPLILDGGASKTRLASTVVDLRGEQWRILREGPIGEGEIQEALS
jgi:tRNA threonylcarbamoyl adenosine modification protein (Sua5/YciO/YrdC/YwlC family)